jgi:hypothetical protein
MFISSKGGKQYRSKKRHITNKNLNAGENPVG